MVEDCDPATNDCGALQEELKELEADLDIANENFAMVDGQFQFINEELRLKEDEARQRAL